MSDLVRELKRARDAQLRLEKVSPTPVFQETESGQVIKTPEQILIEAVTALNNLKNAVTLAGGDHISITVSGQIITIATTNGILPGASAPTAATEGTIGQFYLETTTPKVYICTAISEASEYTWMEVGAGEGSYTLPQADETTLGGVKAKTKTTETNEVAIDGATGKLFASTSSDGIDAESILTKPVTVDTFTGKDEYILAYDETNDEFYLKADSGGGGWEFGFVALPLSVSMANYAII